MKYDFEYVLNSALDGIFIVANDRRLVLFNWACEDLYGINRKDVIDKACWKMNGLKNIIEDNFKKGKKLPFGELACNKERETITHKSGKQLWVETIYTPILDKETNGIAYVMGVIKDISELKQVEAEKERLQIELKIARQEMELKFDFSSILGRSQQILQALKLASQVAKQNTSVMLLGESGTGKELFSRAIHQNSLRASNPFVPVNCAAFPDTLIESELFGYEKGAFTGAEKSRQGKVGLAAGGTLFLDEVTELSASAQAKILRVIQEREFEPLGSVKAVHSDIRVIAATNKDLGQLVKAGLFREDLYYRLFVFPIVIPPLRERPEDLPVLIEFFIQKFNKDMGMHVTGIAPNAEEILLNYSWPGNVRELQNVMERMMILSKNNIINESNLPRYMVEESGETANHLKVSKDFGKGFLLKTHMKKFENQMILDVLEKCKHNKSKAASLLGLTRSTFRYKLSKIKQGL